MNKQYLVNKFIGTNDDYGTYLQEHLNDMAIAGYILVSMTQDEDIFTLVYKKKNET